MSIILIRHLPTAWNRQGLLQGRRDLEILPPDSKGRASIAENRRRLESLPGFEAVLVSCLKRTRMTAECHGYQDYRVEPLLDELDFGDYEGRSRRELLAEVGEIWEQRPRELILGEPLTALEERVGCFLHRYRQRHILAFGHGAWIRAATAMRHQGSIDGMNRLVVINNELVVLE